MIKILLLTLIANLSLFSSSSAVDDLKNVDTDFIIDSNERIDFLDNELGEEKIVPKKVISRDTKLKVTKSKKMAPSVATAVTVSKLPKQIASPVPIQTPPQVVVLKAQPKASPLPIQPTASPVQTPAPSLAPSKRVGFWWDKVITKYEEAKGVAKETVTEWTSIIKKKIGKK